MARQNSDKIFLGLTVLLVLLGLVIFLSASLGLLARDGADFSRIALNQMLLGVGGGSVMLLLFSNLNYRLLKKYSFYIFTASVILSIMVFLPVIGLEHGGAKRWLLLGPVSFQPSEFLKLGFVIYFAAFLSAFRNQLHTWRYGALPALALWAIPATILLNQPDTGTLAVISFSALAMFIVAGGSWKYIIGFSTLSVAGLAVVAWLKPYVKARILTFLDPSLDPLGAGYQIQQSLIAIGSGEMFGRGFGQSIQKFKYLPEPIGDSIFAVAGEEFGFIGGMFIIAMFVAFALRGIHIAKNSPDYFGGLLALGIVILIVSQSFINIGSMLGVLPLTGVPLLFISHGGTALFFALLSVGIMLNISRYREKSTV